MTEQIRLSTMRMDLDFRAMKCVLYLNTQNPSKNFYFDAIEFVRSGKIILQRVYTYNMSGIVLTELDLCLTKSIELGFRNFHGKHCYLNDKCFFFPFILVCSKSNNGSLKEPRRDKTNGEKTVTLHIKHIHKE